MLALLSFTDIHDKAAGRTTCTGHVQTTTLPLKTFTIFCQTGDAGLIKH